MNATQMKKLNDAITEACNQPCVGLGLGRILDEMRRQQAAGIEIVFQELGRAIDFPANFLERCLPRFTVPLRISTPKERTGIRSLRILQGGKDAVTEESF